MARAVILAFAGMSFISCTPQPICDREATTIDKFGNVELPDCPAANSFFGTNYGFVGGGSRDRDRGAPGPIPIVAEQVLSDVGTADHGDHSHAVIDHTHSETDDSDHDSQQNQPTNVVASGVTEAVENTSTTAVATSTSGTTTPTPSTDVATSTDGTAAPTQEQPSTETANSETATSDADVAPPPKQKLTPEERAEHTEQNRIRVEAHEERRQARIAQQMMNGNMMAGSD